MREYRGLTKEGKWVKGGYCQFDGLKSGPQAWIVCSNVGRSYETSTGIDEYKLVIPVIPETVGQYTGLKDCKGVEIYEGDIVEYGDVLSDAYILDTNARTRGIITWIDYRCQFVPQEIEENHKGGHYITHWDSVIDIEIIGDIHTTPELLEKQNG